MAEGFRIKGWHVFAAIAGFFAIITIINGIFIYYAIDSFPGEQEEKSYVQGLRYNDVLDRRARQAALGWRVEIIEARRHQEKGDIALRFTNRDGAPIEGLVISAHIWRPVDDALDQFFTLTPAGEGRYIGEAPISAPGQWIFRVEAKREDEHFEFETKLDFK